MDHPGDAHLLQHVAIVIHAALVDAERYFNAALASRIDRRDTARKPQTGTRIVAKAHAMLGQQVEIACVGPDSMTKRQVRAKAAETVKMPYRGMPCRAIGILALQARFIQMHVKLRAHAARGGEQLLKGYV